MQQINKNEHKLTKDLVNIFKNRLAPLGKFISCAFVCLGLTFSGIVSAQTTPPSSGNSFLNRLLNILVCDPKDKMCDPEYNPAVKNSMIKSPDEVLKFIDSATAFLTGQANQPVGERNANFSANNSAVAVTAKPPSSLSPSLDNDAFQRMMKTNAGVASAVQGYLQKQPASVAQLKSFSEGGEPWAQMFYGLAFGDAWTGIANPAESCRWIKESAAAGVSSARYFIAKRAYLRDNCFSEIPTLEQAKIWAELAAMSSDDSIQKDSRELITKIIKDQLAGLK